MYGLRALLPRVAGVFLIWLVGSPGLAIAAPISRYIDEPIEPVRPSPEEPAPAAPAGAAVGRSPGHAQVSPAGEARYSIPLDLPPGTNGLTPQLSLEYRHTVAGGVLGAGWTVGGLSSISRCRRTIALDGVAGPVTQSRSDRFCLDGHRLVVVNGLTYGSAGAEYRTEIDSFARIRSYGVAGAGPQYFLVEAADGLLLEYGATADSRIDWSGKLWTPRAWALNQVRDRAGNTIDFRYTEDAATGSFRIASVRYNGNPSRGLAPTHELVFTYENRLAQEADLSYVAGSPIRQIVRLAQIDLLYNGSVLKRHELDYGPSLSTAGRSRLVSLRECGVGATECLAPTLLGWQDGRPGLGQESAHPVTLGGNAWIAEPKRWWAADVNGDGRDDLVWAGGSLDAATVHFRLAVATGGYGTEVDTGIAAPNGVGVPLDYDGDGARDALLVSAARRWQVVLGGSNGLDRVVETGIAATDGDFRGVDLDGDGLSDLAYTEMVGTSGNLLQVRARYNRPGLGFSGSPVVLYEQGYTAGYDYAEGGEFLGRPGQRIDLDGDGREDLLMNENYSLARISADERTSESFESAISGAVPADINGDGCTDIAYPHYQGRWRVRFSGCLVTGPRGLEIAGPAYGTLRHAISVIDWNADGKDDLLYGDTSSTWKVVQSAGDHLLPVMDTGVAHGSPSTVVVADLDGDGLQDLATRAGPRLGYRLHQGPVPDLLLSVTDGFGVASRFEYALTTDPNIHTKYSDAVYPQRDLQDGRPVVSRLSVSDGSGLDSMAVTSYAYAGLRSDLTGRGDLGFARRVATQLAPSPGLVFEDEYRQDHPYAGRSARQVVKLSNGRVVRETSRDWATLTHGSGHAARYSPYVSSSRETRFDPYSSAGGGAHTTISVNVDAIDPISGQATDFRIAVTEGAGGENPGATRSERIHHESLLNDTTHWCLGRPGTTRVTARHSLAGGDPVTRSRSQAWDMSACRLTRQQVEPGDPRWQVTIDLAYDAFGNNSRRTVTGVGMAPRITTVGWGARGRFPVALTNPLYETTAIAWEEGAGVPVSLTDTNGLTTRWTYDSFGRLLRETRPDGTRSTWSRASCGAECDPRARYSLRHDEQDAAGSLTRSILTDVDRFDRSLRVATRMPGGAYAEEVVRFDSHGHVASRSVPYWSGGSSPASWHYDHDSLGRLTAASLRSAGGSVERSLSYDHDALAVTSSDGLGHQSTRRWTAWGDPVSVTDALGGTSRYQHSAFGELLRVDDALGNTTSKIAYNVRGMKTGQFDMDLGAWSIFPNALGEVVAWTDAKAQTTTVSYDLLGRPLSRMEAEGVTRWTWGASRAARNVGRLAAVSSPGYSESYIYDSLARLASRRISSDAAYEFSYAYDAAGQLETLTYPASTAGVRLQVGYEYEQGQPVRIVDRSAPGTALWRLGATDAAGNVIDETLGAAVRIVSGFSPLTGLIEYRWASAGGGAPAQDLSYRWDAAGNLLERRDRSRNLHETFGYDAENRLDATTLNGGTSVSLGYDLLGNILWKSDVCQTASGCYSYDATRRHAVTKAGSHSYGYDANGNMTSRNGSSIAWYSYNLPRSLAAPGGNLSQFWYGPLRNRWKQVATSAGSNETTVYVGGLVEKVMRGGSTVWRHYVQGPAGTIAIHLRYGDGSPARTWYRTHDHLGSTDRIVDGTTGAAIVSESFDAFGRRRGNDGTMYLTTSDWAAIRSTTRDGFTGHEHLDNLGLVHMNGRVYDPVIARFLSADPVIQDPYYGQDLNRYSYAWNNPLSVIDPSGLEEVRCMHGPDGRCQGVTVTGLREGRGLGGSSAAYQLWRSGSNGQAASAAQRDPCGQDGSAMACAHAAHRTTAVQPPSHAATPAGYQLEYGTAADYWQGLAGTLGNLGMNSAPVFWLFSSDQETEWFHVPTTILGERGATLGGVGYYLGGLAGTVRVAATGAAKRTMASVGGLVRRFEQPRPQVFYRAYSGDATVGSWLTAVPPRSQAWAQEALALPPWNKATYIQEVLVPEGTLLERSRAIRVPDWGRMRGGAEQFKLLETIPESNFGPGRPLP